MVREREREREWGLGQLLHFSGGGDHLYANYGVLIEWLKDFRRFPLEI